MKDKEIKKMYNDIQSKYRQQQFMEQLDKSTKRTIESLKESYKREKELNELTANNLKAITIKQIENEKEEEVKYEARIPLFEKGELEYFDCNMHSIIDSLLETKLKEKEHILFQRIIRKQEEEIKTLKNNWNELEDWLETASSFQKQNGSEMIAMICSDVLLEMMKIKEENNA